MTISKTLQYGFLTAALMMAVLGSRPAYAGAAETFKAKCAMCHGADGKGDSPMGKKLGVRDFTSPDVQKASDADLIAITSKGKNKMPAYEKSLSEADIKGLVAYIRELGKK
jgi:mono/diheme cytochrome c family protein